MKENFSIRRAIAAQVAGISQSGVEAETIKDAAERQSRITGQSPSGLTIPVNMRSLTAANSPLIKQERAGLELPITPNLVLSKAGARIMTNLEGDVFFGKALEIKTLWKGENAPAEDGGGGFEKGRVFKPKRLTSRFDISTQLLNQGSIDIEMFLRELLAISIINKVEEAAFSAEKNVPDTPDGIFADAESLGDLTWENIVRMESGVDTANLLMGNLAYVTNPALIRAAKLKKKDDSGTGGFIMDKDSLNDYNAQRTNHVPTDIGAGSNETGVVFGNWRDYFLGQWGAIEIISDPYTFAVEGVVRVTAHSYWDMGVIRPESFSIASMKA